MPPGSLASVAAVNRLAAQTSPYLRQHADNPVDWHPWGPDAFAEAQRRQVPVLLSVGYSACHWCHVMAHESFEDPATAALMNRLFVNVKVDREERPDVDAIYMEAVQAQTGHGGWPMTVFLTPHAEPFLGGTYFPPERRHGMPAFTEVCAAVDQAWHERRDDLLQRAAALTAALGRDVTAGLDRSPMGPQELSAAADTLIGQWDHEFGGFGSAPKFPQAMAVDFLLRWHRTSGSPGALLAATAALDAMAAGGIHDHLGGGFARYSTDRRWLVPHFEKMLYDNALLVRAYLHAWQLTGRPRYLQVVEDTIRYVLRDLAQPGGGWASAEDADSATQPDGPDRPGESVEGAFYLWSTDELLALLGDDAPRVMAHFGVTEGGNFEGQNILHLPTPAPDTDPGSPWTGDPDASVVERARATLLDARSRRTRPGLDDKCLTEWNTLMLSALAEAAAATGRADWLAAAVANGEFLLRELRRSDGRWLRSWQATGGASAVPAFAADHAALIDAFVHLAEASGQARWITGALSTAEALLALFQDPVNGGFFTTGSDAEELITRPRELLDNALPSADSQAAIGLRRLGTLAGEPRYLAVADAVLARGAALATQHPLGFGQLLVAAELTWGERGVSFGSTATGLLNEVVVVGDRPDLVAELRRRWLPHSVVAWGEPYPSPLFQDRPAGRAYVCAGAACLQPADTPAALAQQLTLVDP